jgi:phosphoglycerol transferase MdoB-like AlkP superfamily enzyme
MPRFFHQYQFHTAAFHGGNGDFFDRQPAFARMGFDEIWFQESLTNPPLRRSHWGIRDAEIFRLSNEKMRQAAGAEFHFIITLDSHGPFDLIDDDEKEIFPHSQVWQENYFNCMRVLDRDLRRYIESLPAGTLVILYGDHTSGVDYGDFHSARQGEAEFVPCIVHVCGRALPPLNEAAMASLPPDLRVLDIINCMRHEMETSDAVHCSTPGTSKDGS